MRSPQLEQEIKRLEEILRAHGRQLHLNTGVSPEAIAAVEAEVGLTFNEDLKEFYTLSNGSQGKRWFVAISDELTALEFTTLEEARKEWFEYAAMYEDEMWYTEGEEWDARIQPGYLRHRLWFPIAEFNGYSTTLLCDANPTANGKYGQIIVYQHDPEAMYYVAESFIEFFKQSNDLLASNFEQLFVFD